MCSFVSFVGGGDGVRSFIFSAGGGIGVRSSAFSTGGGVGLRSSAFSADGGVGMRLVLSVDCRSTGTKGNSSVGSGVGVCSESWSSGSSRVSWMLR